MRSVTTRQRRFVTAVAAVGVLAWVTGSTGAAAPPTTPDVQHHEHKHLEEEEAGLGVRVNSPESLARFVPALQWDGTAPVVDQTSDLVYAGTGCTPAHFELAGVEGKIAIIDDQDGTLFPGDTCRPTYTFAQKAQGAQQAGAIGLLQVERDDEVFAGTALQADIPALAVKNTDGTPIRDAVTGGTAVNVTFTNAGAPTEPLSDVPCVGGMAGPFPCDGVDLLSFVPQKAFDGAGVSDIWGWTDPETGDEYVFFGKTNGTAFFRVTDPTNPVYLGELSNPAAVQLTWHDIKVFEDHAFIVSESNPHGMTVFDLTRLRGVNEPQEFDRDAFYPLPFAAHNIAINEDTGFAYIVGGNAGLVVPDQCLSGLHIVDISTPTTPTFAGCYQRDGGPGTAARAVGGPAEDVSPVAYVHDTQCVIYEGPDQRYTGREICFNASEDKIVVVDVTNKVVPVTLGITDYPNVGYAHQGWLTEDQAFLIANDELDEENSIDETGEPGMNTRTLVFDVTDLENPVLHFEHFHDTVSIDHNNYVHEGLLYQSNYSSGLRVLDTAFVGDPGDPRLEPLGFFDTFPAHSDPTFDGTWSNYPFFESGTIAVSGRNEGLFLLRLQGDGSPPTEFTLTAEGRRDQGVHTVDLTWEGASSDQIDVFRDGMVIATVENDGSYTDSTGNRGAATYTYQVCEAGSSTCSNEATVRFGGPPDR
jgi:choice-of-anchor B domain-containing protein